MLKLNATTKFKHDRRLCMKRGYKMELLNTAVNTLLIPSALPRENHDHNLTGNLAGFKECHLTPDWLLIYRVESDELMLYRTGTHADLFGK